MNKRPIATRAYQDAIANIGVTEQGGENRGKYVETYLAAAGARKGDPWCMAFVYFRFKSAADTLQIPLPKLFPRTASTVVASNWYKDSGRWITHQQARANPDLVQPGDMVFFYFAAKRRIAHVGIVIAIQADGVWTVEGNTSDGTGVDRDGDGVYKRFRTWKSLGAGGGFGRSDF